VREFVTNRVAAVAGLSVGARDAGGRRELRAEYGRHGSLAATASRAPLAFGAVLVALFVVHALRASNPLLNVRLLASRAYGSAALTTFVLGAELFGGGGRRLPRALGAGDRRVVLNRLTPEGRRRVERKQAEIDERWREALADLSAEQLSRAAQVLRRMAEVVDEL
jgi:hypothetical protein